MEQSMYDAIVVGAGQHGLTTASMLARKGQKVLVLEKHKQPGGLARREEFHSGFVSAGVHNDTSLISHAIADTLNLFRHGLKFHETGPGVLLADSNGPGIHLFQDAERSSASIAHYSKQDSSAYVEYRKFIERLKKFGDKLLNDQPPNILSLKLNNLMPVAQKALALRLLGSSDMITLLRSAPMCVADFLNNRFESQILKAGLAGPAVYATLMGPWSPLSTLNLILWELMADRPVVGGPQAVIAALVASLKEFTGELRTDCVVSSIEMNGRKVKGVRLESGEMILANRVYSSLDPKTTFFKLLSANASTAREKQFLQNFRSRGTTAKIDFAIKGDLDWCGRRGEDFEFVRIGQSLDTIEQSFDVIKYGNLPERPSLEVFVPTVSDKDLAPEGHHVMSALVHFTPYTLKAGWSETSKDTLKSYVTNVLGEHCDQFASKVIASRVLSPVDLENDFAVWGGQIHHGEMAVDQFLPRPAPGLDQYKTSIEGFYLCGSGSFPSGGMSLRNGALASEV